MAWHEWRSALSRIALDTVTFNYPKFNIYTAPITIKLKRQEVAKLEGALTGIIEVALQQGIWAALYIYLFFRMLKENESREGQYQDIIKTLSGGIQDGIIDIQGRLDILENSLSCVDQPDNLSDKSKQ